MATATYTDPLFRKQFLSATQPKEDEFDITKSPLFLQSQKTAESQLAGETPAFEIQSNIAREAQKAASAQIAARKREQLMGAGLRDTGKYIEEGILQPAAEEERARADLERQLAVERQNQMNQRQAQGQQTAGQLLGLMQTGQEGRAQRASSEKVAFAGLSLQEQELAQNAMQFDTRLDFDKWATQAGLDAQTAERVWKSVENEKDRVLQQTMQTAELGSRESIAAMQNDTERWKQMRVEALTAQGWSHEDAMQKATFEQQTVQNRLDRELQAEIEAGRLSLAEKELAQSASQFATKLDFDRYALQAGFDENSAARAWQSSENSLNRIQETNLAQQQMAQQEKLLGLQQTFEASQNAMDRALTSEIEAGKISLADRQLVQQAAQFNTELDFNRWAKSQDLTQEEANRIWATSERVAAQAHQEIMQNLSQAFQEKGIVLDAVMANIMNEYGDDPEAAAAIFDQIAMGAGINMEQYRTNAAATMPPATDNQETTGTANNPAFTFGEGTKIRRETGAILSDTGTMTMPVQGQYVQFDGNIATDMGYTLPRGTYQYTKDPTTGFDVWKNASTGEMYLARIGQGENATILKNAGIKQSN